MVTTINERLNQVAFFHENPHWCADVLARLKVRPRLWPRCLWVRWLTPRALAVPTLGAGSQKCADIERALQRLALGRGGPRDLLAIADTLRECGALKQALLRMCLRRCVAALL